MSRRPILFLVVLVLMGCTKTSHDAVAEPAYGSATCATCQTVVATPRYAAQIVRDDGTVLAFDTPACLFRALRAESAAPRAIRFHGAGDEWIVATDAWFAALPSGPPAHGGGWTAFPSFGAAQDAVAQAGSGEILAFDQARARLGQ
jgi:hypothetical protein